MSGTPYFCYLKENSQFELYRTVFFKVVHMYLELHSLVTNGKLVNTDVTVNGVAMRSDGNGRVPINEEWGNIKTYVIVDKVNGGSGVVTVTMDDDNRIVPVQIYATDVIIERTKGTWYGVVGGQGNFSGAHSAGKALLDSYETKKDQFIVPTDGEYVGMGIAYRSAVWHAFRIYSASNNPTMEISVNFKTTDGGNGSVAWGGLRTHSQWHKDFVIFGGGGDGGHYGEGLVNIEVTCAGIKVASYTGRFWINSN